MPILGAYYGDVSRCIGGNNQDACKRVIWGYYLFPKLIRELERFKIEIPAVPSGPDLSPLLVNELLQALLFQSFGDPNPEPNFPPKLRLQATIEFRDALKSFVAELDKEIVRLKPLSK